MNQLYVKVDAAGTWKSIMLILSFGFSVATIIPWVQSKSLHDERFYWGAGLMMATVIYLILDEKYHYLALERDNLKIYRLFRSTIIIPVSQIVKLSYEHRAITHVLVIAYLQNNLEQTREYEIRSHSTNTLIELNGLLRKANSKLEITIDDNSQKYLNENKDLYLKNPTKKIGWVWFCVKWFLVGLIVCAAFIYWVIPKP